ncbi:MAG: VWA domain-containing protein [Rhodobacteraceae bacterium]|nr:VWA domain-containing protein [Paracoccaceae bacterium]
MALYPSNAALGSPANAWLRYKIFPEGGKMIDLKFSAEKNGLRAGYPQTFNVLLRISSAESARPAEKRSALNIALVIDKSGSMAGDPLNQAKRAASMVLERLADYDRLSIIAYDQSVEVPVPSMPVRGSRLEIERAIHAIQPGGTTALFDGWNAGAQQLSRTKQKSDISRVMLLSDGCANAGLTDVGEISQFCARMADSGVSTSTYGLGLNFNELLMAQMAEAGQGRPYYGQTADDLMDPFQEEFELFDALVARSLRLKLTPEPGVRFKVLNLYREGSDGSFILPDLAHAGEVWALLEVEVCDEGMVSQVGSSVRLLTARADFKNRDGEYVESDQAILGLDTLNQQDFARLEVNPDVQSRLTEIRASQMQSEAAEAARRGDWQRVDALIAQIRETGQGNAWVVQSIQRLQAYADLRSVSAFAKEADHKAHSMRNRMASMSESAGSWSASEEAMKPRYLRRKLERGRKHPGD